MVACSRAGVLRERLRGKKVRREEGDSGEVLRRGIAQYSGRLKVEALAAPTTRDEESLSLIRCIDVITKNHLFRGCEALFI